MTQSCMLSLDLEDYKHATMRDMGLPPIANPAQVRRGVERLLGALAQSGGSPKITFFTTGQIARDQRDLVSELSDNGHEIGCHTYEHDDIDKLGRERFAQDLRKAVDVLESASGKPVRGFRAPNFSINERTPWFHSVLADCGFSYDSSEVRHAPRDPREPGECVEAGSRKIYQFPMYGHRLPGGRSIRVIGGTFFRVLPEAVILRLMRKAVRDGYVPLVYLHPADLDDKFEAVSYDEMRALGSRASVSWLMRQKNWSVGTRRAADKLKVILEEVPNRGIMVDAVPESWRAD